MTEYERRVKELFGDIDDEKWHDDPRIRIVECGCGRHHAHIMKDEYAKIVSGDLKVNFSCAT